MALSSKSQPKQVESLDLSEENETRMNSVAALVVKIGAFEEKYLGSFKNVY